MELKNKEGLRVVTLNDYGYEWGMTFVNGGCDEAIIDTGDSSTLEDFFKYLEEMSDLTKESVLWLQNNFFEDRNWAMEIEDGAEEALLENGYEKQSNYYFVLKND